jgi:DNA polymerase-1
MLDELVTTKARLDWWVNACTKAGLCAFDTETTGLSIVDGKDQLVGLCLAISPEQGCYIPVAHTTDETQLDFDLVVDAIAPLLANAKVTKVMHNASFDINVMAMLGVKCVNVEDTQLMSYALDGQKHRARGHSFDALCKFHLEHESIRFEDVVLGELGMKTFADVQLEHATAYASEDARKTLELYHYLWDKLCDDDSIADASACMEALWRVYTDIDRPLAHVVADMKRRGVQIDLDKLEELDEQFASKVAEAQEQINELAGRELNVNSPKELAEYLFKDLDLPILAETKGGAPKTDKDTLEQLEDEHPVIPLLLEHSKFTTLKQFTTSWFDMVDANGRLHPGFNLCVTNTRRLSGSDPNLQNVPARSDEGSQIRSAFVAPKGRRLVCQDMSQIEYRLLAHTCGSEKMRGMFRRGEDFHAGMAASVLGGKCRGEDFHAGMAASVLGGKWQDYTNKKDPEKTAARSRFKNVNFAKIYGAGPKKIARMCKITEKAAYKLLADYSEEFPEVDLWKSDVIKFAHAHGYAETLFGGRIHVPTIRWSDKGLVAMAERQAVNGVIQGTAADMMRLAMAHVSRWLRKRHPTAWLLLSVHDELVVECDEDAADEVREGMKHIIETCADHLIEWSIPIVSEGKAARSWGEAK